MCEYRCIGIEGYERDSEGWNCFQGIGMLTKVILLSYY